MTEAKFKQILAIDVEQRIPDFTRQISYFSKKSPISKNFVEDQLEINEPMDVEALVVSIHQTINQTLLEKLPALRYLGVLGTSLKKIPLKYCAARKITVTNVTEYCDHDTAEWVMLKLLEFFRGRRQSAFGKTMGVIGVGAVGRFVMDLALALGMKVRFNTTRAHPDLLNRGFIQASKEEIFRDSDVVSFHTPAFVSWLSAAMIKMAKPDACLINTCMGRVSVASDLEEMLKEREDITLIMDKIAGVYYPELKGRALISSESAFLTIDAERRLIEKFLHNLGSATCLPT